MGPQLKNVDATGGHQAVSRRACALVLPTAVGLQSDVRTFTAPQGPSTVFEPLTPVAAFQRRSSTFVGDESRNQDIQAEPENRRRRRPQTHEVVRSVSLRRCHGLP